MRWVRITIGRSRITIPPGETAVSDRIAYPVRAFERIGISFFAPELTPQITRHLNANEILFLSVPGDYAADPSGARFQPVPDGYASNFLAIEALEVAAPRDVTTVVTDERYWSGDRPKELIRRQLVNANLANVLFYTSFAALLLSAILFTIGVFGIFVNRKNIIVILMSIELILLAVNINFVAFSTHLGDIVGQVFAMLVLTVAAPGVPERFRPGEWSRHGL